MIIIGDILLGFKCRYILIGGCNDDAFKSVIPDRVGRI